MNNEVLRNNALQTNKKYTTLLKNISIIQKMPDL